MADPVTSNRGYAVPTRGSDVNTWDTPVNGDFNLIDQNLGAVTNVAVTNTNVTLNAAQVACGTISVTGALSANVVIIFPGVQGWWSIENLTTNNGAFGLFIACGSTTTSIGIPPGETIDVQININVPKYRNLGRIGSYLDLAATAVPRWVALSTVPPYLNCDGSTFSAGTYPFLNAFLGGNTLPDLRGVPRFTLNQGTGRLTSAGSGLDGNTLFATKFSQTATIVLGNLPAYTPVVQSVSLTATISNNQSVAAAGTAGSLTFYGPFANQGVTPTTAPVSGTITMQAQGGTSAPLGIIGTGTIGGITLIRAA